MRRDICPEKLMFMGEFASKVAQFIAQSVDFVCLMQTINFSIFLPEGKL